MCSDPGGEQIVLFKVGLLFDGTGDSGHENWCIKVEDRQIVSVGPADAFSSTEQDDLIDYSEYTILPGLVDAHVHLFLEGIFDLKSRTARWREDKELTLIRAVKNLEMSLNKGVTTVRDLGGPYAVSGVLKKAFASKNIGRVADCQLQSGDFRHRRSFLLCWRS